MMQLVLAVPKGRIGKELQPLLAAADLTIEADYYDKESRKLKFTTNHDDVDVIRVRSFDVATFTAYGGAHIGIAGSDVLAEFDYPDIYAPLDLNIGICRISLAAASHIHLDDLKGMSHVRVATKYPNTTRKFFAGMGIQAECIKLNGAMELAPKLGLTDYIVDLVSTGQTLKSNGLHELLTISQVSSRLVMHRQTYKTHQPQLNDWLARFKQATSLAAGGGSDA